MDLYTKGKLKLDEEKIHEHYLKIKNNPETKIQTEEYICDKFHYAEPKSLNDINTQIAIDSVYIDFGASVVDANDEELNDQKSITITNKTKGKIIMSWNLTENQTFTITPVSCEIPPMKNYSFRIKFQPRYADQFYKTKLEGYALYKSLVNFTLADPKFVIPSWCLNIDCIGKSFRVLKFTTTN